MLAIILAELVQENGSSNANLVKFNTTSSKEDVKVHALPDISKILVMFKTKNAHFVTTLVVLVMGQLIVTV